MVLNVLAGYFYESRDTTGVPVCPSVINVPRQRSMVLADCGHPVLDAQTQCTLRMVNLVPDVE